MLIVFFPQQVLTIILLVITSFIIWSYRYPFGVDDIWSYLTITLLVMTIILLVMVTLYQFDLTDILLMSAIFAIMITIILLSMEIMPVVKSYYHPFGDRKLFYWSCRHPLGVGDLWSHYDLTIILLVVENLYRWSYHHPFGDGDLWNHYDLTIIV